MNMKINKWASPAIIAVLTAMRIGLGTLFIVSSYAKLQYPDLFIEAVQNYRLLPEVLGNIFGTALPWAELLIGWCLVLGIFPTLAAAISIPMILSFIVANVTSFFKDVGEACGCLGDLVNMSHTTSLIVDFVMLAVVGSLIYQRERASVVSVGRLLRWEKLHLPRTVAFTIGAAIIAVAMIVTAATIPEEKSPWKERINSALKDNAVVVLLFWEGEPSNFLDEFRMCMELDELYGRSICVERIDAGVYYDAVKKFEVHDFPTIIIIEGKNKKGYIVYPQHFAGAKEKDALLAAIDEVLASKT